MNEQTGQFSKLSAIISVLLFCTQTYWKITRNFLRQFLPLVWEAPPNFILSLWYVVHCAHSRWNYSKGMAPMANGKGRTSLFISDDNDNRNGNKTYLSKHLGYRTDNLQFFRARNKFLWVLDNKKLSIAARNPFIYLRGIRNSGNLQHNFPAAIIPVEV